MSDSDPDTNGGLPPKITLKPKTDRPQQPETPPAKEPAAQTPETTTPKPLKPITLRKPVLSPGKPVSPSPLKLKKPDTPSSDATDSPTPEAAVPSSPATPPVSPVNPTPPAAEPKAAIEPEITIKSAAPETTSPVPERKPLAPKPPETEPKTASDQQTQTPNPVAPPPSSTENKAAEAEPAAPKRPVLRPVGSGAATIKKPVPIGIRKEGTDPLAAPGTKKSTSRITLPPASDSSTTGPIKTIKIPPRSQTGKTELPEGSENENAKPAVSADPKRQTSRISLEAVLGGSSSAPAATNAPATIKIKRAPAGTTANITEPAPDPAAKVSAPDSTSGNPTESTTPTTATNPESQKKTLKVRRTSAVASEKSTVGGGPQLFAQTAQAESSEPEPHWFFGICSIAATLIAGVLIYVLVAQVTDPDLTEPPQPDSGMPWPARISR